MPPLKGFVARPFHQSCEAFGRKIQEIASGFSHLTVEQLGQNRVHGRAFFDTVREEIRDADFLLADFTVLDTGRGQAVNGNVLTEAGIALGLNKDVYLVARATKDEQVLSRMPSDWKSFLFQRFGLFNHNDTWDEGLRSLFARLLQARGLPTAPSEEQTPRSREQQYLWLLRVTTALHLKLRWLQREGALAATINEVKAKENPKVQTFDVRLDEGRATVRVTIFLADGPHLASPFLVAGRPKDSRRYDPIAVNHDGVPARQMATSHAVERCADAVLQMAARLEEQTPQGPTDDAAIEPA